MRFGSRTACGLALGFLVASASSAEAQRQVVTDKNVLNVFGDREVSGDVMYNFCATLGSIALPPDGQGRPYLAQIGDAFRPGGPTLFSTDYISTTNKAGFLASCPSAPPTALFVGGDPGFVAYGADGHRVYVVDRVSNLVTIVDAITNTVERNGITGLPAKVDEWFDHESGTSGFTPVYTAGLAVSPDGKLLFIPSTEKFMSVLDATTLQQVALVNTVNRASLVASGIALKWPTSPADRRIYVVGENGVSVYSGATYEWLTTIPLFSPSRSSIVASPDGSRLYLEDTSSIYTIDTATNTAVLLATNRSAPLGITGDGRYLYASDTQFLDLATNTWSIVTGFALPGLAANRYHSTLLWQMGDTAPIGVGRLPFASFDAGGSLQSAAGAPFSLSGSVSLGAGNNAIDPAREPVTMAFGHRVLWLPAGSFEALGGGAFHFAGILDTNVGIVNLDVEIHQTSGDTYAFTATGTGLTVVGGPESMRMMLLVGDDGGSTVLAMNTVSTQLVADLQTQLSASQADAAMMHAQNDRLVQESASLFQQIEGLTGQVQTLTAQIQALTEQVAVLTTINQALTAENVHLTDVIVQLTTDEATLRVELAQVRQELQTVLSAIDSLNPGQKKAFADALAGRKKKN